jgi:hypothetical protein
MNTRISFAIAIALGALGVATHSRPALASGPNVDDAQLTCLVDTYAFDQYTTGSCVSFWAPNAADNPTIAAFEVIGLPAPLSEYSFVWSVGSCGSYISCTRGIALNQTVSESVTVTHVPTGQSKTVSATAEFLDGWN